MAPRERSRTALGAICRGSFGWCLPNWRQIDPSHPSRQYTRDYVRVTGCFHGVAGVGLPGKTSHLLVHATAARPQHGFHVTTQSVFTTHHHAARRWPHAERSRTALGAICRGSLWRCLPNWRQIDPSHPSPVTGTPVTTCASQGAFMGWLGSGCRGRLPICLCMPRQPAPSTASMSPRRAFSPPPPRSASHAKRSRTALGAICRCDRRRRVHRRETLLHVTIAWHRKGILPALPKQPAEMYLSPFLPVVEDFCNAGV
jgi:hypothetical protein